MCITRLRAATAFPVGCNASATCSIFNGFLVGKQRLQSQNIPHKLARHARMTVGETLLMSLQGLNFAKQCPCSIASDLAVTILILAYCHFLDNLPNAFDLS